MTRTFKNATETIQGGGGVGDLVFLLEEELLL